MSYFSSYFGSYFSTGADVDANRGWFPRLTDGHHTWFGGDAVAPVAVAEPEPPRLPLRSRTLRRAPLKVVRRRIDTPEGPVEILVPDPFDEIDLVVLLAALAAV